MPRARISLEDSALLTAALEGLQLQKQRIEDQIRDVRARLGRAPARGAAISGLDSVKTKGRKLSEAARKRIAAAQKRRWAEYRKASAKG